MCSIYIIYIHSRSFEHFSQVSWKMPFTTCLVAQDHMADIAQVVFGSSHILSFCLGAIGCLFWFGGFSSNCPDCTVTCGSITCPPGYLLDRAFWHRPSFHCHHCLLNPDQQRDPIFVCNLKWLKWQDRFDLPTHQACRFRWPQGPWHNHQLETWPQGRACWCATRVSAHGTCDTCWPW